jgi:hypothetical protein
MLYEMSWAQRQSPCAVVETRYASIPGTSPPVEDQWDQCLRCDQIVLKVRVRFGMSSEV